MNPDSEGSPVIAFLACACMAQCARACVPKLYPEDDHGDNPVLAKPRWEQNGLFPIDWLCFALDWESWMPALALGSPCLLKFGYKPFLNKAFPLWDMLLL